MFLSLLQSAGEEWKLFFTFQGEFPTQEELLQFDGFVVTGSM